jgi:hypothetical protein
MGPNPCGRIIYDAGGRIAVLIGDPRRVAFPTSDSRSATDAEVRAAFDSYLAYFGTFAVHADQGFVVHHLEMSLLPNWTGGDQVRHFELQGDRLTLKTPSMVIGGVEQVATLVWERLP